MGAVQSIPQDQEPDPWWPTQSQQEEQCNQHNVAIQDVVAETIDQEEESWLKMQELSKAVQHLADEHISLTGAQRQADKIQKGELNDLKAQHMQQELVIRRLEEDVTGQQKLITILRDKLELTEKEKDGAINSNKELSLLIEELHLQCENSKQENVRLQEQLATERKEQEQLLIENKRLAEILESKQSEAEQAELLEGNQSEAEQAELLESNQCETEQRVEESEVLEAESTNGSRKTLVPSPKAEAELERFRQQMKSKREARHQALQAISNDMERLRGELVSERAAKCEAIQELEQMKEMGIQNHMETQLEESMDQLNKKTEECQKLESDMEKYKTQVLALKEVVTLTKQMLAVRENQVAQLKQSLQKIEGRVMGGENTVPIPQELRAEYESQMSNIKSLKALYLARMKIMEVEKEKLQEEHKRLNDELESETKRSADNDVRIQELETMISERNQTVSDLQDQLSDSLDQSRNLSNELALINNIFTQMLVGSDTDLDKLIKVLQENHDLMTEITTNEDCDETAASLPRLLLNLISQINTPEKKESSETLTEASGSAVAEEQETTEVPMRKDVCKVVEENGLNLDAHEIASKLPKIWKVLLELISQQVVPAEAMDNQDGCYTSIDTPNGPRPVISVSKTFIRLKDLILEKKSLQKELGNLKQLNGHLESKLIQQEKRLSLVSTELRKTWSVVGRMRTQYQQLHTHEKVLRYELQQKRKLLNELKEELEYCREKWVEARKKNSQSEVEWRKLRKEFSSRKKQADDSFNNSGESGYSDDRGDESGDDDTGQSTSPIQDTPSKDNELDHFEDLPVNSDEILSETENTEESSVSSQNSSLPDLVSISSDHNVSPLLLPNDSFQNQVVEQITGECPSISFITSLKQQLSHVSRDLEKITSSIEHPENIKAIQSIFSLPAIQVPEHLLRPKVVQASPEKRNPEEVLDARAARLKRLEEQSQQLFNKITRTSHKSTALSNRLEELHGQYGAVTNIPETPALPSPTPTRSPEEILEARAARLNRLEEQCQQLFNKVTRTTQRSTTLSNQLDELHQHYGPQETPTSSRFENTASPSTESSRLENTASPSTESSRLENTTSPSTESSRLDSTASTSTDIPIPPPLPKRLPSMRLPTSLDDSPDTSTESQGNENT